MRFRVKQCGVFSLKFRPGPVTHPPCLVALAGVFAPGNVAARRRAPCGGSGASVLSERRILAALADLLWGGYDVAHLGAPILLRCGPIWIVTLGNCWFLPIRFVAFGNCLVRGIW